MTTCRCHLALELAKLTAANLAQAEALLAQILQIKIEQRRSRDASLDAIQEEAFLRAAIWQTVDEAWTRQIQKRELESGITAPDFIWTNLGVSPPEERGGGFRVENPGDKGLDTFKQRGDAGDGS